MATEETPLAPTAQKPRRRRIKLADASASPAAAPAEPRTWKDDLADVRRVGFWVWLVVLWLPSMSLAALSGPEGPKMAWHALVSGSMDAAESAAIGQALTLTAPLTTAIAIIGVALLRGWFQGEDWYALCYSFAFLLMVTTLLAKSLSIGAPVEIAEVCPVNFPPFSWLVNLAVSYWRVYTPRMFFSSAGIGGFLAWAVANKIWPRFA